MLGICAQRPIWPPQSQNGGEVVVRGNASHPPLHGCGFLGRHLAFALLTGVGLSFEQLGWQANHNYSWTHDSVRELGPSERGAITRPM